MTEVSAGLQRLIEQSRPRFRTATALVSDTLRMAIMDGSLGAGEALRQDSLAEAFGVSRMPVREALRRLEAEGLIEFIPHRGAVVAKAEPVDIAEVFEIRRLLETYALRGSVPNLTDEDFERAGELLDEIDREDDVGRWGDLNRRFHLTLYGGFPGKRLLAIIDAQHRAVDRYVRMLLASLDYRHRSQDEHREILRLCRERDPDSAAAALEAHLSEGPAQLLGFAQNAAPE